MAEKIRIEFQSDGFQALLNSGAVRADLEARANIVAATAGSGFDVSTTALAFGGSPRPGVVVHSTDHESREAEAVDKSLSSAIWAGGS